jgi:hypothetical protein
LEDTLLLRQLVEAYVQTNGQAPSITVLQRLRDGGGASAA